MSGLSLESMPALSIPLRFFLTAPWFGILASLLLLFDAEAIHSSRWSMEILAFTHLLTLGFMLMIMVGALFQFIPVITGFSIPGTLQISPIIHMTLIAGTLFLVGGFLLAEKLFFQFAIVFLLVAVGIFTIALTRLLLAKIVGKEAIYVLRLVNVSLFVTLGLGIYMATAYAFPEFGINMRLYTDVHLMWGLLGWTILLIMAVSSQVVPMFHVTPVFPANYLKGLSSAIIIILFYLSAIYLSQTEGLSKLWGELVFSLAILFFSVYTFNMVNKRKRKVKDITINFWRLALVMPVLAVMLYWLNGQIFMLAESKFQLLLGMLIIFGFTISSIMGMIQKIVAFISYIHLQRLSMLHPMGMGLLPNMQTLITVKSQEIQFYLHLTTIILLALAILYPALSFLAAMAMLFDFICLTYTLTRCALKYRNLAIQIKQA